MNYHEDGTICNFAVDYEQEISELEAKIKLQDQRIENLLKAVEFYPIQLKAAEALTRDKELMSDK